MQITWRSYAAIHDHAVNSDSAKSWKHRATSAGLKANLESPECIHSWAVMPDALEKVSVLSEALKSVVSRAYQLLKRTIRALTTCKHKSGSGVHFQKYKKSVAFNTFKGIKLNAKVVIELRSVSASSDWQLEYSSLFESVFSSSDLDTLFSQCDTLELTKWPSNVESSWINGEENSSILCVSDSSYAWGKRDGFRDFIDNSNAIPLFIQKVQSVLHTSQSVVPIVNRV